MFPDNNYIPTVITLTPGIGEAGKGLVYVRQRNPAIDTDPYDKHTPYIALTSRCAHLGCPVRWVLAAERFICPCHGGVYDLLGRRVAGPPPRPLDRFYTRVVDGMVQIGSRFSVNSELRRFSPATRASRSTGSASTPTHRVPRSAARPCPNSPPPRSPRR